MKKLVDDCRGGLEVRALGDKNYKYPEYATEYAPKYALR